MGYVYDVETGLYYLQSRYYNPEWGRFLSADNVVAGVGGDVIGYNLFAYCFNDPVNMSDSSGNWPRWMGNVANWITKNIFEPIAAAISTVKQHVQNNVIKHNVPLYDQGDHDLCWAYCQVMVESYNSGKNLSQKEADLRAKEIACEVNGADNWDAAGWPTNLGREVEINSIQALYDAVSQNGPVYAYYYNNKAGEHSRAHLVLVTGVNLISGRVYTNNPWGVKGRQTYKSFQKGVARRWFSSGQGMTFQCIYLIAN